MENSGNNPTIVNGDLLELSPMRLPHPILKPSQKDNLIMLQTPVQKNLKVSFLTPKRTPLKEHNLPQSIRGSASQIPTHIASAAPSHITGKTETIRQTDLPMLMKPPNSVKYFKSSLVGKDKPQQSSKKELAKKCVSKWESLRKLDENSRWRDRVEVITKLDHEEYTACAQEVIHDIISSAIDIGESKPLISATKESSTTFATAGNVITPVINIEYEEDALKNTENTLTKHRLDTYDVTSPCLMKSPVDRPVISAKDQSLVVQCTLTGSHSSKILQPGEPNASSTALKSARSFSDGNNSSVNNNSHSDAKARHQSLDLDQIKFDFDPISRSYNDNDHQPNKKSPKVSLNQSVFSPVTEVDPQQEFALRAVDSIFGDGDFVDSAKLIDRGHLDLDYLENKTSGTISEDLQKESLYVKFDPLLEGLGNRQSIALLGRKSDIIDFSSRVTPIPEETNEVQSRLGERKPDLLCDSPPRVVQEDTPFSDDLPAVKQGSSGSNSSVSFTDDKCHEQPSDNGLIAVLKYTDADLQRALQKRKDKWTKEEMAFEERRRIMEERMKHLNVIKQDLAQRCEDELNRQLKENAEMEEYMAYQRGEQQMANMSRKELTDKMSMLFRKVEQLQNVVSNHKSNEKSLRHVTVEMQ